MEDNLKFYIGVTDNNWFNYLSEIKPDDINFWQPGGGKFKVISPGAPFLFKLKSPNNVIAGVGFLSSHTLLPLTMAWDTFGNRNGCETYGELYKMISRYRSDKIEMDPIIGCIILTDPVFFKKEDWIKAPENWSNSIVKGKSYSTEERIGEQIWSKVKFLLYKYGFEGRVNEKENQLVMEPDSPAYGNSILTKVRLGQRAFRVMVTDAYSRKCSISGEKTLPVLEAAHIKPYALSGPHRISNAILLRSDIHKLFDMGYVTITKEHKVEISKRIKEEYENGKEYYQYHGRNLMFLPNREIDKPQHEFVQWHNENVFKG